jgi:hypothetical protein
MLKYFNMRAALHTISAEIRFILYSTVGQMENATQIAPTRYQKYSYHSQRIPHAAACCPPLYHYGRAKYNAAHKLTVSLQLYLISQSQDKIEAT